MKIVFIGCVQFSSLTLKYLLTMSCEDVEIVGIVTRKQSTFNADFFSLIPIAEQYRIPYFVAEGNDQQAIFEWLKKINPDVIYCFGWSYLLDRSILDLPRLGVVGYHPSLLPQHRGRHPIIWALVLGLKETGSTFFMMDEKADAGPIIDQKCVVIEHDDDAQTLYDKLSKVALKQINHFTLSLAEGRIEYIEQDHEQATYWRKRGKADGQIDWRKSAEEIYNLVRALTRPYVGAHFIYQGRDYKVWRANIVDDKSTVSPGTIQDTDSGLIVKCGSNALRVIEHDFDQPIKKGDCLI